MKKTDLLKRYSLLAIALTALIGFSMAACDNGGEDNPNDPNDPNTPNNPNNPTTPSGTVWKTIANNSFSNTILDIAYGNNTFVAVSGLYNSSSNVVGYSSDGINWTTVAGNYSYRTNDAVVITYGNNIFVTGSYYGSTSTSTDGITWTNKQSAGIAGEIKAIAYGDGKFIAGNGSGKMAYSSDGSTWTAVADSTFGYSGIATIAYGNNKFVAGGGINKIAYSSDGITWTAVTNSALGTDGMISTIAYGNGKFVAGGYNGKMAYSSDGITWTTIADSPFNYPYTMGDPYYDTYDAISTLIKAIAYGNGKFVALNMSGKTAVSTDGAKWTVVSDRVYEKLIPTLNEQYGGDLSNQIATIAYGNGKFVVGGPGKSAYWDGK